jgi:hypothetical protein
MWAGGPADISGSRIIKEVIVCSYTREGDWQNTSLGPTSQVPAIHWWLQCHQCALLECRSIYYYNTQQYRHLGWLSFHWLHKEPTKPLVPNSTLVDQISVTPYQITTTQTQCRFTMINTKSDWGFVCTGGQSVVFTGIWAYTMAIVCLLCGVLLLVWQTYTSNDTSFKEEVLLPESKTGHRVPVCCVLQFGVLVLSASHPFLCSTSLLSHLLHRSPFTMKITVWNPTWTLSVLDQ